jgi:fermentation-respiration switch protein FrsA (DUF1100 family)
MRVNGAVRRTAIMTLRLVLTAFAVIVVLVLAVRWLEPRLAFFPTRGETVTPGDFGVAYTTLDIATTDGERLRGWAIDSPAPRARVIYFHGNGGNLSNWAPILTAIVKQGYSVLAFDYRGYGASTGRPTERGLYRDVEAVVERFWNAGSTNAPLVYWGRSLGVVMAAHAAAVRAPDRLILESGFADARSLVRSSPPLAFLALFSTYSFPCAQILRKVTAPVLVMHGDRDQVIPIANGRRLFESITGPKQFVTIPGGDHNDLAPSDPAVYWRAVERFIADQPR